MAHRLSREEVVTIQVLRDKGMPQRQIAREVGVTESTVRYHVRRGRAGARDGRAGKDRRADAVASEIEAWLEAHGHGERPPNLKELHRHHGDQNLSRCSLRSRPISQRPRLLAVRFARKVSVRQPTQERGGSMESATGRSLSRSVGDRAPSGASRPWPRA